MYSLRTFARIGAAIFGATFLLLIAINLYAIRESEYHIQRGAASSAAMQAYRTLELETTRYFRDAWLSAQQERFAEARNALDRRNALVAAQDRVRKAALAEISSIRDAAERHSVSGEVEQLARIVKMTQDHEREMREALYLADSVNGRAAGLRRLREVADSALFGVLSIGIDAAVSKELADATVIDETGRGAQYAVLTLSFALAAVSVLLLGVYGYFLTRSAIAPVERMSAELGRAGFEPNAAAALPLQGPDEVRMLARSFNQLMEALRIGSAKVASHQADLEAAVRERTAELEEVNRRFQEADRERTRFLSDISHEIRTPLTLIRGEAEIALRRKDPAVEEQRVTLRRINELSAQIASLVEDLLFVARQRDAGAPLAMKDVDIAALLATAREDALALARGRNLMVSVAPLGGPLQARGDGERLRQALLILVDNASRYAADEGSIELAAESAGGRVIVRVSNDGPGIKPAELPFIFDRYFRGGGAAQRAPGGAGLGLVLARAIARAHGGELSAQSVPGKRTVFSFELPGAEQH